MLVRLLSTSTLLQDYHILIFFAKRTFTSTFMRPALTNTPVKLTPISTVQDYPQA